MIYSQFDFFTFLLILFGFYICFWGIGKLLKLEKRGWEIGPMWLFAKTTRLNRFINKLANRFPRFWRVFWTIGIGFGFGIMIFGMIWLGINLYTLLSAPQPENAIILFIPGVTVTGSILLYMILPIAIIMFSHEISHGIASRISGVKVKSSGIFAFIFFFGAFVEVDDEQVAKKKRFNRQQFYAAGSFTNLVIAFFAMLFIMNMYNIKGGAYLVSVDSAGPSYGKLYPNEIILGVNGTAISYSNLSQSLDPFKPFDPVLFTVRTENGTILDRITIAGFDRSKINDISWITLQIFNGSHNNGTLDSLREYDQNISTFQSSNNFLNFSLIINLSMTNINLEDIIALVLDLGLNGSADNFDIAKVFLTNFSNPAQNYEFFSLQNLLSGFNGTSNISKAAGYNLTDYFNASNCLNLNFVFNHTTDFLIGIDLCRLYIITNDTENYFGIRFKPIDRELAIILGPLAPHVYQMLFYLFMFSFAVAVVNLLPIPPFDGDKLFTSLFGKDIPSSEEIKSNQDQNEDSKDKQPKPKEPWTWKKTIIWSVRGTAIFLFLSNIILSILLFDISTLVSSFLY